MTPNNRLPSFANSDRGYRLHKLEVLNWGTFDGRVYTVRPAGKSALLIGQNGCGKSTLVDALLTLLVRPGVRNFNVAAGAKKRERDEKSYLRGAFDRGSDEGGQGIQVKFLRPKGDQYAVILAWFYNADLDKSFTAAQLLYLAGDQSVEKLYCLSDDERSIQDDFSNLGTTDGILKILRQRGFRATRTFHDFEGWFATRTRVKPKAMEVFNQTVAVKDIQKLNDFIRDHMLEQKDWDEKVDRLLAHFSELSDAHESLVRVRLQRDLLIPVDRLGRAYQEHAIQLAKAESILSAIDAYFSQRTIDLFTCVLVQRELEVVQVRASKDSLSTQLADVGERLRKLQNEIDNAGGERLRQIPDLIRLERAHIENKRLSALRFGEAMSALGVTKPVQSESRFNEIKTRLPATRLKIEETIRTVSQEREQAALLRADLRRDLGEIRRELVSLDQRRENIPEWCVSLREECCRELGLATRDFPFAAELIAVKQDDRPWESSIEKVLRGFALSMLAPDRYYQVIAAYLDGRRLMHAGRGQRLVYLRVIQHSTSDHAAMPGPKSLYRKLDFREGHPLVPWVKAELSHRFDYTCCDDIEEFRQSRGLAMTVNRHLKTGNNRHEKDDRDQIVDPRNFVLGWDNREKKQRLNAEINRLRKEESAADNTIAEMDQRLERGRARLNAVSEAERLTSFNDIDFGRHEQEIVDLEKEKKSIEDDSGAIKVLKKRWAQACSEESSLRGKRDEAVARERELDNEIAGGKKLLANAKSKLKTYENEGTLKEHACWYPSLDAELANPPLSAENLFQRKEHIRAAMDSQVIKLRKAVDPILGRLIEAMSKFLRQCPENANNLHSSVEYLDSFLALKQRIEADDLPRHEQRFKERLNQKVIEEIGLFRTALEQERRAIEEKIELLNVSLKKLDYREGTHIQLEPRPIRDPEVTEFQGRLRECIEGSFEDSAEANEARFLRIRELVAKLRDESNRRWRDKVTDVRRWFDFVAAVIDPHTQKPVSVYQDSSGQSGGEKAKLAFTILVAAIAYQYDLDPDHPVSNRFHFVVVDEMFSKVDDQHAEYALDLFKQFGLQLLIVAPLDAKARITQPYVGSYLHVVKRDNRSAIFEMSAREFEESVVGAKEAHIENGFTEA